MGFFLSNDFFLLLFLNKHRSAVQPGDVISLCRCQDNSKTGAAPCDPPEHICVGSRCPFPPPGSENSDTCGTREKTQREMVHRTHHHTGSFRTLIRATQIQINGDTNTDQTGTQIQIKRGHKYRSNGDTNTDQTGTQIQIKRGHKYRSNGDTNTDQTGTQTQIKRGHKYRSNGDTNTDQTGTQIQIKRGHKYRSNGDTNTDRTQDPDLTRSDRPARPCSCRPDAGSSAFARNLAP